MKVSFLITLVSAITCWQAQAGCPFASHKSEGLENDNSGLGLIYRGMRGHHTTADKGKAADASEIENEEIQPSRSKSLQGGGRDGDEGGGRDGGGSRPSSPSAPPTNKPSTLKPSASTPTLSNKPSTFKPSSFRPSAGSPTTFKPTTKAPVLQCGVAITSTKVSICQAYSLAKAALTTFVATATAQTKIDAFAIMLRVAFHDAAEVDITNTSDKNGPDGCLSSSPDNAGLVESTSLIKTIFEPMWQTMCDKISRADFWVLMGKLVVEAADPTATIRINYQYGRIDSQDCSSAYVSGASRLPDAQSSTEIQDVFVSKMGMTVDETVALFGGHTLGHVHAANSGFGSSATTPNSDTRNAWDSSPDKFDNQYYVSLLKPWQNVHSNGDLTNLASFTAADTKNIWFNPPGTFDVIMLNSDMAMAYTINKSGATGTGVLGEVCTDNNGCRTPTTPNTGSAVRPSTNTLVHQFAADNTLFLNAFAAAYAKMCSVGYGLPANIDGATATGKLGTLTAIDLTTCPA